MIYIREASEDEMVALFLKTEIKSTRFRDRILAAIDQLKAKESIVTEPNLASAEENDLRREILSIFRGYGRDAEMFEGYPGDIRWVWVDLSRADLERVRYIDYSYWNELSSHTRLAKVAATNIRKGIEVFGVSNDGFLEGAKDLLKGASFPPMILVVNRDSGQLTVLEGHFRLTVYMLEPDHIPQRLRTMVGLVDQEGFDSWNL